MTDELPNNDGNPYDFGDVEYWESLGVSGESAQLFVEGFPAYWRDVGDANLPPERIAGERRPQNLWRLAHEFSCPVLVTHSHVRPLVECPFPDEELAAVRKRRKDGYALYDNPFAFAYAFLPGEEVDGHRRIDVPLKLWEALARCLIESLKKADIPKKPLPHGVKARERLADGAVFRGRTRLTQEAVLHSATIATSQPGIRWGPMWYFMHDARRSHFLVIGTTRSGKTTLLRLFLQSMFLDRAVRCVVYDYKGELLPLLHPSSKRRTATHYYYLFNPYDRRGVAWDVAKDVDRQSASTLAAILIPDEHRSRRDYFLRTSRQVLTTVIRTLIAQAEDRWTFLDLMLAIQSDNIRSVLSATDEGRRAYKTHLQGDGQTQQNVLSELDGCSERYMTVAAAWSKATDKLSLRQWAETESKGIVIGNSLRNHADLQPVNQAILHFLFHELLDATQPRPLHTFMILDEFTRLGRLPVIEHVLEAAPGQGLSLALGIHDVSTLTDIYGQSANGILGACGFRAYLRVQSAETAKWMSNQIGAQDVLIEQMSSSESESVSPGARKEDPVRRSTGTSVTTTYQHSTRPAVPPEDFMQLPLASAGTGDDKEAHGVFGYFQVPIHAPYRGRIEGSVFDPYPRFTSPDQLQERLWAATDRDFNVAGQRVHFQERPFYPTPPENFLPPEDSFSTLAALGFARDQASHSVPIPKQAPPTPATPKENGEHKSPQPVSNAPAEIEVPPSESTPKRNDLTQMRWDDELEMFVPNEPDAE